MKKVAHWYSERVQQPTTLARWGVVGTPVLFFPTAAADGEEIERFLMIRALDDLLKAGRIKVYSVDSISGRAWLEMRQFPRHASWLQTQFHEYIRHEVVPAIRADCNSDDIEVISAGASIGAFNALACLCRYPDVFRSALCISGTYDLSHYVEGNWNEDFYFSSPFHFLPGLEGPHLELLRRRQALFAYVGGLWEDPTETWQMSRILGAKGVPNWVHAWGTEWDHDWPAWRAMSPIYLDELTA